MLPKEQFNSMVRRSSMKWNWVNKDLLNKMSVIFFKIVSYTALCTKHEMTARTAEAIERKRKVQAFFCFKPSPNHVQVNLQWVANKRKWKKSVESFFTPLPYTTQWQLLCVLVETRRQVKSRVGNHQQSLEKKQKNSIFIAISRISLRYFIENLWMTHE